MSNWGIKFGSASNSKPTKASKFKKHVRRLQQAVKEKVGTADKTVDEAFEREVDTFRHACEMVKSIEEVCSAYLIALQRLSLAGYNFCDVFTVLDQEFGESLNGYGDVHKYIETAVQPAVSKVILLSP